MARRIFDPEDHFRFWVTLARGTHPFPSRTRKLSLSAPIVLHAQVCGRLGSRPVYQKTRPQRSGFLLSDACGFSGRNSTLKPYCFMHCGHVYSRSVSQIENSQFSQPSIALEKNIVSLFSKSLIVQNPGFLSSKLVYPESFLPESARSTNVSLKCRRWA